MTWFVKRRRAQNPEDYETWQQGGVSPTLNAFDNTGDSRATVLIFTAQRVGEPPRIYENTTPSLLSRMGTGGNNVPMIAMPEKPIAFTTEQTPKYNQDVALTLTKGSPTGGGQPQSVAQPVTACDGDTNMVVRRLTPTECERLMGFPDNHTLQRADGKTNSDSTRYKMCGNGVATPVARWIAEQLLPLLK
jgi:site-specific DNA-cytosine methylase